MFAQDDFVGLHTYLTDTVWETFTNGWEEQGYDIYWGKESFYLDRPDLPELQLPSRFKMQIERATDLFYSLNERGEGGQVIIEFDDLLKKLEALSVNLVEASQPAPLPSAPKAKQTKARATRATKKK